MTTPLLSICIPTFNRKDLLFNSINSIVSQPEFMNGDEIEIVISDNCSTDNTHEVAQYFINQFGEKVKYFKNDKNILDKNFEAALRRGNGALLKLANDSLFWDQNSLKEILEIVRVCQADKPMLFFLNGHNWGGNPSTACDNLDEFISQVSYMCTWIGGFSIWKDDLDRIEDFSRSSDKQLIQVDVLFRMISSGKSIISLNKNYFNVAPQEKGGYSIAKVFGRNYLSILKEYSEFISPEIYALEKKRVLIQHIFPYYFNKTHKFIKEGFFEYLEEYKSENYFYEELEKELIKLMGVVPDPTEISPADPDTKTSASLTPDHQKGVDQIWRELNQHNKTYLVKPCDIKKIKVGNFSYGPLNVHEWGNQDELLEIGSYVSIAEGVTFLLGGNHSYQGFSTYPFKVQFLDFKEEAQSKGPIKVCNDVWLGHESLILSGLTIGQGAIVGARSVVTKDLEPYGIYAGNPAKFIKFRFPNHIVEKLLKVDFSKLDFNFIQKFKESLYDDLSDDLITEILEYINRLD